MRVLATSGAPSGGSAPVDDLYQLVLRVRVKDSLISDKFENVHQLSEHHTVEFIQTDLFERAM